jgi:AcrR family transcriptional regulator
LTNFGVNASRGPTISESHGTILPPSSAKTAIDERRPRASGLSRERIIGETIAWLRANPQEKLTIARAAAAAGATTMAVYRHFCDGADLAESIVDRVLAGLSDEIPRDADWRTQVRAWMDAIYQRLVETPQTVELLTTANGLSTAWIRASESLRLCLSAGGLGGPELTDTTFWIALTVIGSARQMLAAPLSSHVEGTIAAIRRLDPEGVTELSSLAGDVPGIYARAREIMLARTLASIEPLMGRQ